MVLVDLDVALGPERQVEESVHRHELEHVVEERQPRRDLRLPRAVQREADLDVGLLRAPGAAGASRCGHQLRASIDAA